MPSRLNNPFPLFLDTSGEPLHNGAVYMGVAGQDPETHPVATFWDDDLTIPAAQPFQVMGGFVVNPDTGGSPAFVYTAPDDYSLRVRDEDGGEVFFLASISVAGAQYQPLDSDLTAIAALSTTAYGRALLTLANQAALKAATGIPDPLPLAGGAVTGPITRQGAGAHLHHVSPTALSGNVYNTDSAGTDPTLSEGDIWLKDVAP